MSETPEMAQVNDGIFWVSSDPLEVGLVDEHDRLTEKGAGAFGGAAVAERIAQRIEREMKYEGPRAQRVMRMCAEIARKEGGS